MLQHWMKLVRSAEPDRVMFRVLDSSGAVKRTLTLREVRQRVGAVLQKVTPRNAVSGRTRPVILAHGDADRFATGFLAALLAGRTVIPLPPIRPDRASGAARLFGRVVSETGADLLLADSDTLEALPNLERHDLDAVSDSVAPGPRARRGSTPEPPSPATILYTSGSTTVPKGVVLGAAALEHYAERCSAAWNVRPSSELFTWIPSHHSFGFIFNIVLPLATGCRVTTLPATSFLERPVRWMESMSQYRSTHTAASTFGYRHLLDRTGAADLEPLDLSSLEFALVGAEPIPRSLCEKFSESLAAAQIRPARLAPIYGLSETGPVSTHRPGRSLRFHQSGDHPRAIDPVFVGSPLEDTEVRVIEPESGSVLPDGREGEVLVSSPAVLSHYWQRDEETDRSIIDDQGRRWFRTGDLGVYADGELCITGRIKELIIVRGKKFYPHDIEWIGREAAGTSGAAVAFLARGSDPDGDGDVVLVLEAEQPAPDQADRAATAVAEELGIGISVQIHPVGTLPRTSSGKIQRGEWARNHEVTKGSPSVASLETTDRSTVQTLLQIFERVLGRRLPDGAVVRDWSDWQLDSLQTIELAEAIERTFAVDFSPTAFFRRGSIDQLHRDLDEARTGGPRAD